MNIIRIYIKTLFSASKSTKNSKYKNRLIDKECTFRPQINRNSKILGKQKYRTYRNNRNSLDFYNK